MIGNDENTAGIPSPADASGDSSHEVAGDETGHENVGLAPQSNPISPQEDGVIGRLAPEARRAVVGLLKQGVILAVDKRLLFETICRHQTLVSAHLADMYLRLLVDEKAGIALILQQDSEDLDENDDETFTSLVTRRTLSLYDTLLLLVLRKHYQERQASGEQSIFIDLEHIEARMTPFLPLTTSTRSDRRVLSGALDNMRKRRILAPVRGDQERFEITQVIRYVVNAQALEHLLAQYQALLEQAGEVPVEDSTGV